MYKRQAENGIASLEEAEQICLDKGVNAREIVHNTQSIAFQNAEWAYTLGCALAIKKGAKSASEAAAIIGEGIQLSLIHIFEYAVEMNNLIKLEMEGAIG